MHSGRWMTVTLSELVPPALDGSSFPEESVYALIRVGGVCDTLSHTLTHALSHTLTQTLTPAHTHTQTHSNTLTHTLTLTHTHTHTH